MLSLSSTTTLASLLALTPVYAREITFPPISPRYGAEQYPLGTVPGLEPGPLGLEGYGLTTFANLPYVYCLSDKGNEDVEKFDVAFLGAGFDTVSSFPFTTYEFFIFWVVLFFCVRRVFGEGVFCLRLGFMEREGVWWGFGDEICRESTFYSLGRMGYHC